MPGWSIALLISVVVFGSAYLVTRYSLKRVNIKPSHKGLLLGLLAGLSVFVLARVLKAFDIDLFAGTAQLVLQAVLIAMFLGISVRVIYLRIRSRPELADLGPSTLQAVFIGIGILLIFIGMSGLIGRAFTVGQAGVNLAQGIFFVTLGFARNQVRADGIYHFGGRLPWNQIARYEWSKEGTLLIDLRRRRWWQDRVQVPVPALLAPRVDELMRLHVP